MQARSYSWKIVQEKKEFNATVHHVVDDIILQEDENKILSAKVEPQ